MLNTTHVLVKLYVLAQGSSKVKNCSGSRILAKAGPESFTRNLIVSVFKLGERLTGVKCGISLARPGRLPDEVGRFVP